MYSIRYDVYICEKFHQRKFRQMRYHSNFFLGVGAFCYSCSHKQSSFLVNNFNWFGPHEIINSFQLKLINSTFTNLTQYTLYLFITIFPQWLIKYIACPCVVFIFSILVQRAATSTKFVYTSVSQRSILGPSLFTFYTSRFNRIITINTIFDFQFSIGAFQKEHSRRNILERALFIAKCS